jgi:hypothetical protein
MGFQLQLPTASRSLFFPLFYFLEPFFFLLTLLTPCPATFSLCIFLRSSDYYSHHPCYIQTRQPKGARNAIRWYIALCFVCAIVPQPERM